MSTFSSPSDISDTLDTHSNPLQPWKRSLLHLCCEAILAGKILAIETDTVPGLAVNAFNPQALKRLYQLKKREAQKPIVWMTHAIQPFEKYIELSSLGRALINKYWPGALTIIFPLTPLGKTTLGKKILTLTGHPTDTLALRIPRDNFLCACLAMLQTPLAVTSANYAHQHEATSLKTARELFKFKVDIYLERSHPMSGITSTVVDLRQNTFKILRLGEISPNLLKTDLTL